MHACVIGQYASFTRAVIGHAVALECMGFYFHASRSIKSKLNPVFFFSQILFWFGLIGNRTSCRPHSVCNHTCDEQIGLRLCDRPILEITRMIADRNGLH